METRFPPEAVASFVAWLCHPSCPVSGEAFSVGGWRAARVVLAEIRRSRARRRVPTRPSGPRSSTSCWPSMASWPPTSSTDEVSWLARNLAGELPEAFGPGGPLAWDRKPR